MILYRNILNQSLKVVWKYKHLWFFGFFAAILGSFLELELILGKTDSSFAQNFVAKIQSIKNTGIFSTSFFPNLINLFKVEPIATTIMLVVLLITVVLMLFLLWVAVVSQAGLIGNASGIIQSNKKDFKIGIKEGMDTGSKYFWAVLGINIIVKALLYLIFLLLSFLILFVSFQSGFDAATLITNLILFIVFIPLALVIAFISKYAICYVVIKGEGLKDSIKAAFRLFLDNWLISIEMAVILFFISVLGSMVIFLGVFVLFIPFYLLFMLSALLSWGMLGFWVTILGLMFLAIVAAIAGAALSAFRITAWTSLFLNLNSKKKGLSKIIRLADSFKK